MNRNEASCVVVISCQCNCSFPLGALREHLTYSAGAEQLLVFYAPESQVDAWLRNAGLFWNLVLEVPLCASHHNQ